MVVMHRVYHFFQQCRKYNVLFSYQRWGDAGVGMSGEQGIHVRSGFSMVSKIFDCTHARYYCLAYLWMIILRGDGPMLLRSRKGKDFEW